MRASLLVRRKDGKIIEVGPQIEVDHVSVRAEVARLLDKHGPTVLIDQRQVYWAREAMERDVAMIA